jgi:hypothetical protein
MLGVLGQNKALSLNTPMNVIGLAGFVWYEGNFITHPVF